MEKSEITVEQLEQAIEECFTLKKKHGDMKKETAKKWVEVEQKQKEIEVMLTALDKTSYKSKSGTFGFAIEEGYSLPKDDISREEFFKYLKEKEMYETMITVSAQSLNSFAKGEVELAENNGDFEFIPPGLVRREPRTKFNMRKS